MALPLQSENYCLQAEPLFSSAAETADWAQAVRRLRQFQADYLAWLQACDNQPDIDLYFYRTIR